VVLLQLQLGRGGLWGGGGGGGRGVGGGNMRLLEGGWLGVDAVGQLSTVYGKLVLLVVHYLRS
jgi:hypothetical protein